MSEDKYSKFSQVCVGTTLWCSMLSEFSVPAKECMVSFVISYAKEWKHYVTCAEVCFLLSIIYMVDMKLYNYRAIVSSICPL